MVVSHQHTALLEIASLAKLRRHGLFFSVFLLCVLTFAAPAGLPKLILLSATSAVSLTVVALFILWTFLDIRREQEAKNLTAFIKHDQVASFITDASGQIRSVNAAAIERCDGEIGQTVAQSLRMLMANPSPVLARLRTLLETEHGGHEDVATLRGHLRISVHGLAGGQICWRVQDLRPEEEVIWNDPGELPFVIIEDNTALKAMNAAAEVLSLDMPRNWEILLDALSSKNGQIIELSGPEGQAHVVSVWRMDAQPMGQKVYFLPAALHSQAAKQEAIDALPVPLLRVSPEGDILAFNNSAKALVGDSLRQGALLVDLMEGLGRSVRDWLDAALQERSGQNSEFLRLRRADKEVFVQVTLNPLRFADERGLIAVLNDATELKTLEAQFVQSQKMQAIGQLAGGVAHDFNNLLTAISGHCDLLLLRHDHGDQDYADLTQINQNANRAAALVSQLLAFSRKQTLRPKTLDMRETLSDLSHLLNRLVGERVTLKTTLDENLPQIHADKRQLEQVLMNLVVNARDAMMPEGGEIKIHCAPLHLDEPLSRDSAQVPAGEYVHVSVSDEGVGIAQDMLQKVFEPFFTTKRTDEGTGLGLSTAYGIVKQTGGFIFVDSVVGEGTTFSLYLPAPSDAAAAAPAQERAKKSASLPAQAEGVILLVEDEAPVRAFASRALRLRGYTVLEADSAEAALETLHDPSLDIDVFVTDVVMPGMDGPSWVKEALTARPDTKVVFVSGYAEDSFGETQARIPNSVFLPKPFSLTDLAETVHKQLH